MNGETVNKLVWSSVNAACRSQPVAVEFPFDDAEWVKKVAKVLLSRATSGKKTDKDFAANSLLMTGFSGLERVAGELGGKKDSTDWRDVQVFRFDQRAPSGTSGKELQLFKFGVMSYLLPRYLFMANSRYNELYKLPQWTSNNEEQKQCYGDGRNIYRWEDISKDARGENMSDREKLKARRRILTIPSQAICARWMPNLEGIVVNGREFFGIDTAYHNAAGHKIVYLTTDTANPEIYCPTENPSQQYVLDNMSVRDPQRVGLQDGQELDVRRHQVVEDTRHGEETRKRALR